MILFFFKKTFDYKNALQISIMIIIKGLDGKDKGEMRQDSSRKKILPFEFVVLEACLETVISSLENEVCALYSLNLFLIGEYAFLFACYFQNSMQYY